MTADQVFNPAFWYLMLALTAFSLPLYILILWKSWKGAIGYLGLILFLAIYMAFFSVHNFGGAFGAGMALSCLTAFLVPISLLVLILLRRPFRSKFGDDLIRRRLYVFGGLLIILTQLFPILGSYSIDTACFRTTRGNAEPLIFAIETFQQKHDTYPLDIASLQPEYISEIPVPGCSWLSAQEDWYQVRFELYSCSDGVVLLTNESTDGTSIERYNFVTANWSSISFLDGACSYLR